MNPKCISLIESFHKYSINGLTEFLEIADVQKPIQIFINIFSGETHHASMMLLVTSQYIEIGTVERLSDTKGIIKDLLYIVACKAVELNLPVQFKAEPGFLKRNNISKNTSRLYKYYNNMGFTRKNKNKNYYNTSVINLKKMVTRRQKKV